MAVVNAARGYMSRGRSLVAVLRQTPCLLGGYDSATSTGVGTRRGAVGVHDSLDGLVVGVRLTTPGLRLVNQLVTEWCANRSSRARRDA